jgi:hypothetical protein
MGLTDIIMKAAGDKIIGEIASKFSLDGGAARKAVESLLPEFAAGVLGKSKEKPNFLARFRRAVESGQHAKYVDAPAALAEAQTTEDGNKILGHVLGSKEKSREIARKTAGETGLDYETVKKMLPMVAAGAMGGLSKAGIDLGGDDLAAALKKLL